jgi:hypothetical protein
MSKLIRSILTHSRLLYLAPTAGGADSLLLETGDHLLLETGDRLLLE